MVDLSTRYLGLELDNPLVPSASPLSRTLDSARRLEDAGAGALVMYSLFEEEIEHEDESLLRFLLHQAIGHGEADSFLPVSHQYRRGLERYLEHLQHLKQALSIPVIASLNGVGLNTWVDHGAELQQAGADALELNIVYLPGDPREDAVAVEERYLAILRELRARVELPITMKLSPQFSSLPHFLTRLEALGANGAALFQRFYQPDIDLDSLQVTPRLHLSDSRDALLAMNWIAMLYGRTGLSLAATGGVHNHEDALKMILVGADVVHLASALIEHGPQRLSRIKHGIEHWLEQHDHHSLGELRGSLSRQHAADPSAYERSNYVWVLDNYTASRGVWR